MPLCRFCIFSRGHRRTAAHLWAISDWQYPAVQTPDHAGRHGGVAICAMRLLEPRFENLT
jgi:hypothetical protein